MTVDDMEVFDGQKRRPLHVTARPVRGSDGQVQYAIAAFTDVSEQKRAQKLLEDYNRRLEKRSPSAPGPPRRRSNWRRRPIRPRARFWPT